MVRATFAALGNQTAPRLIAAKRGKKINEIFGRRPRGKADEAQATAGS